MLSYPITLSCMALTEQKWWCLGGCHLTCSADVIALYFAGHDLACGATKHKADYTELLVPCDVWMKVLHRFCGDFDC